MNSTTLKPCKRKKERYALKAFLWGVIISALFIVPSIVTDRGMYLYCGDYNSQIIPFYQTMSTAIKNGAFGWNQYTDLGTSFVGEYSCYNLGSPFFWFMVIFPVKAIPYLLGPITILKFGLSSLNAFYFLKRYTKDKNNAVIGSMLYAFSGFAIYGLAFDFADVLVFFPLLLAALDMFIYDNKRGRFALMTAVCAVVNYYFFAAEAVFCLIYWIVRMAAKSYRTPAKDVVYLIFEAIMGAGLSMFIFLPSLYHIADSAGVSGSSMTGWNLWVYENSYTYVQHIISFFVPPEPANTNVYMSEAQNKWLSVTAYLPLFGTAGVFAVIFNKHRNKWMRVFYGICAVFMLVPVLNSAFQLFIETNYVRWFFMLLLIMSLGSVTALEDPSTKWKKAIGANLATVSVIAAVIGFSPFKDSSKAVSLTQFGLTEEKNYFWIYIAAAMINLALCALAVSLYKKDRTAFKRFGSLVTAIAIVITMSSSFIFSKINGEEEANIVGMNMINKGDNINIEDIQNWRSDVVTINNYTPFAYDKETVESSDIALPSDDDSKGYTTLKKLSSDITENIVNNEESKYYLNDENLTMFWGIPGFESSNSMSGSSIKPFLKGIGLENDTLTSWPLGMYGYRSLFSVKYMFNHEDTNVNFENEDGSAMIPGWKYLDTQNGYDIYENEYAIPMGFTFDNVMLSLNLDEVPTQYKHLVMTDALIVESLDDMFACVDSGMKDVSASDYDFTEEEYLKHCEDRIKSACYEFSYNKKGFEAKIDTAGEENDKFVFFSVPYDLGWKATVNGEKAEIMAADYSFMAVRVPANTDSKISFEYHTPGIFYGTFFTVVCLVLLVIYLAAMKIQSSPDEEESKENNPEDKENSENNNGEIDEEEISIFDIVKQTEEENMMHVYKRVPVVLESGFGSVAYDINYKKYIDFTSGIGVNALGFANGSWTDAVEKQMDLVQHTSNIYYNTTQIQLAEMLCIKTGYSKVFFANSGAEANECAIKLARKYGSDKYGESHTHIVTLENSFHGRTITTLAATGQEAFHKYFMPFTEGFGYAKANDMESIKSTVTEDTCAVMIELIQGEGGVNPLDREFVAELAEFCKENDILLIVDEIQTGVGRTGKFFCYENYDIKPDIITSAKALGGGLPLSACLCNEKLQNVLTTGTNGTTFGGNTIACAGSMKIVDIVSDEEFLKDVRKKGKYMRKRIKAMNGVKEVRGLGLMIGIVLEKNNAAEIQDKCAENGLLVLTAKNLVRLLPPLNIDYIDIDEGLDILEETINDSLDNNNKE